MKILARYRHSILSLFDLSKSYVSSFPHTRHSWALRLGPFLRVDLTEKYLPFLRMLFRLPSVGPTLEPSCREGDNLSGKAIDSERAGVEGSSGVGFHRFRVRY